MNVFPEVVKLQRVTLHHEAVSLFDLRRDEINLEELRARLLSALPSDGQIEPYVGIRLSRVSQTADHVYGVTSRSFCLIAEGVKEIYAGERVYRYDPAHYLLATAELPVRGVHLSSPYLGITIALEPALVGSVMVEAGIVAPHGQSDESALGVSRLDCGLLDATTRLIRLLDSPTEAKLLIPHIKREIIYRLLTGEQGSRLRQLPSPGGRSQIIGEALDRLRREFNQPVSILELARDLGMSTTRFHHHFKAITAMSPLQFQKQLRLQEARRLMLSEELDASSAGYRVGYDDASHFNRDYKKHFGESPARDVAKLRKADVDDQSQIISD